MKLIQHFDFSLAVPDCHRDAGFYRADVFLTDDISEALPYLNAELKGADFNPGAQVLLWKEDGKKYAFRTRKITIAPVQDREEAQILIDSIVPRINAIWDRRAGIKPNLEGLKSLPNVLDIYKKLPKKNCGECGYPSCMAFAGVIREDPDKECLCPYISE